MTHKHWCEIGLHEWDCDGTNAIRIWAGETEPSPCTPPPDDGVEMVTCPEHREEERRRMPTGQDAADILKIYDALIGAPDDSIEFEEAMRVLREYILGKDDDHNPGGTHSAG
jgi:hypothetical protein